MTANESWIAVDIGASAMRAWQVVGEQATGPARQVAAPGSYTAEAFESLLLELIGEWLGAAPSCVLVSGFGHVQGAAPMVPYVEVPLKPGALKPVHIPVSNPRIRLFAVPGTRQARPVDVTRGDEVRIAGFLARNPSWDGVICCVGRVTTWAHVSADELVSFQAAVTGEMFEDLSHNGSMSAEDTVTWDGDAFDDALDATLSRPETLAMRLHGLRAQKALGASDDKVLVSALAGCLVGAELGASRPYWLGQRVAVIGDGPLVSRYEVALERQGVPVERMAAEEATLEGLRGANRVLMQAP